MRTLLILRHGAATREDSGSDRDRTLTARGVREAEQMGQLLLESQLVPDRILSSSAERAKETARLVALGCHFEAEITELDALYLAEPEAYITAVQRVGVEAERVLVVGHNPGLEALSLLLTGEPRSLPTAGLVVCTLPIASFSALTLAVNGELSRFERPQTQLD